MATFDSRITEGDRRVLPHVRCDSCSDFDDKGHPLPLDGDRRSWVPTYGARCERCGVKA